MSPDSVHRDDVLRRLRGDLTCLLLAAPAGYGKTTALATWAADDDRPCIWLTLGRGDSDPTVLIARLLLALDQFEPMTDETFASVLSSDADLARVRLPRLAAVVETRTRPFVLILDDVHLLGTRSARSVVRTVAEHVPPGSSIAVATRDATGLGLSRARAGGRVVTLGRAELAMSVDEGAALLRATGLDLHPDEAALIVERAEGWPAGLYLCALALRDVIEPTKRISAPVAEVTEYLRDEILESTSPKVATFLLRTSILDRLSAPLCDAVLDERQSGAMLDRLVRSNRFVIPLGDADGPSGIEWVRYHHFFRDLLLAELRTRWPDEVAGLHARASLWFEEHDDPEAAVLHACESGDRTRAAALLWSHAARYAGSGRTETLLQWLGLFRDEEIAVDPHLALTAAWCAFTDGDTDAVHVWTTLAASAPGPEVLSNGTPLRAAVELLDALVGRDGVSAVQEAAAAAAAADRPDSPFRAIACVLDGAVSRLLEDRGRARERLELAVAFGSVFVPATHAQALGFLALLAADDDDWAAADILHAQALRLVDQYALRERPAMCTLFAGAALGTARQGATQEARELAKQAAGLVGRMHSVAPWVTIEAQLLLARVSLLMGDGNEAKAWLTDADSSLTSYANAGTLSAQATAVRAKLEQADPPLGLTASPLTAAELRVLRYLPTHLSFAQIAGELFVSRNTVKTQAIAIYRKLEVTSRAEAVERARALGVLTEWRCDPDPHALITRWG